MSRAPVFQERIPKIIYQLHIQTADEKHSAFVRGILLSLGCKKQDLIEGDIKGQPTLDIFNEDATKIKGLEKLFKKLKLHGVKVRVLRLRPSDWLTL